MARTYKWLGGIGYILEFIPYVNFISPMLVAIAWIMMGRDTREGIFTALGVLMIVLLASAIAFLAWMFFSFMALAYAFMPGALAPGMMGADLAQILGQIWIFVIAGLVIAGLAIAVFITEIIAHFRAGRIFDNRWFKVAGWMRIILIVALAVAIPLTIFAAISASPELLLGVLTPFEPPYGAIVPILLTILWPLIIAMIIALLATIFSIIAFFTIPEEAPPARPQSQPQQP